MALNKSITLQNGVTSNYHRIEDIRLSKNEDAYALQYLVYSYVNEDVRRDNKSNNVNSYYYTDTVSEEELNSSNIMTITYGKLKEKPAFEGATDC